MSLIAAEVVRVDLEVKKFKLSNKIKCNYLKLFNDKFRTSEAL